MMNSNAYSDIHALILAAGKSERMGQQKLLLPFGGKTIIETVIDNILKAGVENILVVLGSHRENIQQVIQHLAVSICYNPDYSEGMHTSVIRGFNSLPGNAGAAMVFLGDQPFIPEEVIQTVMLTWIKSGKGIIIPTYQGKRGHPVLFDLRLKDEVNHLDPGQGLRSVLLRHPEEISEAEVNFPQVLRDIDTKNDYIDELNLIEQKWKKKSDSN